MKHALLTADSIADHESIFAEIAALDRALHECVMSRSEARTSREKRMLRERIDVLLEARTAARSRL